MFIFPGTEDILEASARSVNPSAQLSLPCLFYLDMQKNTGAALSPAGVGLTY